MIRKIGLVTRTYRHANRYREIVQVLIKHGFGDIISMSGIEKAIDFGRSTVFRNSIAETKKLTRWERIRLVLEELGPTFIKLGQIISNRPDLIPQELLLELEKLQDAVPPFSKDDAIKVVEKGLREPISDIFLEFTSTPLAAGSIAQVHKAILYDGQNVVVKVQRPDIKSVVEVDMEIMLHLATMLEKHIPKMKILNIICIVEEFDKAIRKELDFTNEANYMERFGRNFQLDRTIYVPKCYRDYTTNTVLTMEFIDGIKISDISGFDSQGISPEILANRGANLVLKQIFEYGFFHADPHPGNMMALQDNVICFLDYGMMGVLSPATKEQLAFIVIGIVNRDTKKIVNSLVKLSRTNSDVNKSDLEMPVAEIIEKHFYQSLKNMNIIAILSDLLTLFIENDLKMPSDFYLLLRAIIIIQASGKKLSPEFDIIEHMEPYAKKIIKEQLSIRHLTKDAYVSITELMYLLRDLPSESREIIERIKRGKIKVDIEHKGLDPMLSTHEQISNRIAFAIVLASIVIGSSLIALSKIPPLWNGVPIIGIAGFLGAGILGFWLLISILKHGKM